MTRPFFGWIEFSFKNLLKWNFLLFFMIVVLWFDTLIKWTFYIFKHDLAIFVIHNIPKWSTDLNNIIHGFSCEYFNSTWTEWLNEALEQWMNDDVYN